MTDQIAPPKCPACGRFMLRYEHTEAEYHNRWFKWNENHKKYELHDSDDEVGQTTISYSCFDNPDHVKQEDPYTANERGEIEPESILNKKERTQYLRRKTK